MSKAEWEIDHIDPRWKEGRDYQLVCGLDILRNKQELSQAANTAKSNRFLPWRWSKDEIGCVPQEPGDLAQFLVDGEWVLLEFMSEEWFAASKHTCATANFARDNTNVLKQWETLRANPTLLLERNEKIKRFCIEQNTAKNMHDAQRRQKQENPEEYYAKKKKASLLSKEGRYQCTVTGHTSTAGGLTLWQKNRGIDPTNRKRIPDAS